MHFVAHLKLTLQINYIPIKKNIYLQKTPFFMGGTKAVVRE